MNRTHSAFWVLLRAGLWKRPLEDLTLFPLSDEEWKEVYDEARRQTVSGLVYQGIALLPDGCMPSQTLLLRWTVDMERIEQRNLDMNRIVLELSTQWVKMDFQAVVLKGQGVATFYEEPLLRECGDIDFYFPYPDERQQAEAWLTEQGTVLERKPDGSVVYVWKGITIEHHSILFDLQNPKIQPFLLELEHCYEYDLLELEGIEIWVPSPMLNMLMLNAHILKHAMGRGVGLRQLCDMARAYAALSDTFDFTKMKFVYRKSEIRKWTRLLHAFLTDVLGMPEAYLPYKEERTVSAAPLLDIVLEGGNFGQHAKGGKVQDEPVWRRKWNTFKAFVRNAGFSLKYAPREAVCTFGQLVRGQFK